MSRLRQAGGSLPKRLDTHKGCPKGVGVRGDPDYPYINHLRIHDTPFIPTDRGKPCPYTTRERRLHCPNPV